MLYGGGTDSGSGGSSNQFKTTVIDTIVAEVQSVPGEDRCVLLLGYRDQMQDMFQVCRKGYSFRTRAHMCSERQPWARQTLQDRRCVQL